MLPADRETFAAQMARLIAGREELSTIRSPLEMRLASEAFAVARAVGQGTLMTGPFPDLDSNMDMDISTQASPGQNCFFYPSGTFLSREEARTYVEEWTSEFGLMPTSEAADTGDWAPPIAEQMEPSYQSNQILSLEGTAPQQAASMGDDGQGNAGGFMTDHASPQHRAPTNLRIEPPLGVGGPGSAPLSSRSDEPVPIPPARKASADTTVSRATGPMRSSVALPPRPKPGRKPLEREDDQHARRRTQNREAQRNFRDKRNQKHTELQEELARKDKEHTSIVGQLRRELADVRRDYSELRTYTQSVETRLDELGEKYSNLQNRISLAQAVQTVTPEEDAANLATDYTSWRAPRQGANPDVPMQSVEVGDCGFCTDSQNCQCRQPTNADLSSQAGTCARCLQDPEQARACREIAANANPPPSDLQLPEMMPCSTLMHRFGGSQERLASISEIFGQGIQAFRAPHAGFQTNEQEAAQALHTLATQKGSSQ